MIKKIFTTWLLAIMLFSATPVFATVNIVDQVSGGAQSAINGAYGGGSSFEIGEGDPLVKTLAAVIGYLLTFTGVVFFFILLYGGYLWMTARGNEEQVTKAKKITRDAIIGIIIIVAARIAVELVIFQLETASQTG